MANGKLTGKQQRFIDEYLQSWNATDAARKAGYKGNDVTLATVGKENIRKPHIAEIIKERLNESGLTAEETLKGLADIARSDLSEFFTVAAGLPVLDFEKAEQSGQLHLLKKLTLAEGKVTFELYDKQRALETFAKHHGLLDTKVELSGEVKIVTKGYVNVSPDDWEKDK